MKLNTVIVGSGSKGGSGKTFALVTLTFALKRLGYRTHLIDADHSNRTLSKVFSKKVESGELTQVNLDIEGDFQKAVEACAKLDNDIISIVDMPGSITQFFLDFFEKKRPEDFQKIGIRLVFAVTVCNTAASLQGVREMMRICMGAYPMFALKSNVANLKGTRFDLKDSNTGKAIIQIAQNRVIEIEQLSGLQRQEYDRLPAAPNEFEVGGRAAAKLGLTHLSSIEWVAFGNKAIENVAPHAE